MEPNSGANSINIRNIMKMPDILYGIRHFHLEKINLTIGVASPRETEG